MKMSKGEKILLAVFIVILIGILDYQFVYRPQAKVLDGYKSEKEAAEQQLNSLESKVAMIPQKQKKYDELMSKMKDSNRDIYPTINQERLILELNTLLKSSNVEGSIAFTDKTSLKPEFTADMKKQNEEQGKAEDKKTEAVNPIDMPTVEMMFASLNVSGTYEDVIKFITNIENYQRNIVVPKMNITSSPDGKVSASTVLQMYAVKKVDDDLDNYMKWDLNGSYGKPNPLK